MAFAPAFLDDESVAKLLPPGDVLGVIRRAFIDRLSVPQRSVAEAGNDRTQSRTLLAMLAVRPAGVATLKLVNVVRGDRQGLASHLMAFDPHGKLLAVIEAHSLTALRTAAVSVLAAQAVGAVDRHHIALLGAGRQARAQLEAFALANPRAAVTIWARRRDQAAQLAASAEVGGASIRVADNAAEAVRDADLVTCATASQDPLVLGSQLAPGTHVDVVGSFRPDMREADDALIMRAEIVADCRAALVESGDLVQPIAAGVLRAADVRLLEGVLAGQPGSGRGDITLFKSVGNAAQDLVTTELLLERLGLAVAPPDAGRPGL